MRWMSFNQNTTQINFIHGITLRHMLLVQRNTTWTIPAYEMKNIKMYSVACLILNFKFPAILQPIKDNKIMIKSYINKV